MRLIYHELLHITVGLIIALIFYKINKSWKVFFIIIAISLFLDIDHSIDLILANGNISQIINGGYFLSSSKSYVLLHSWELLIPWWIYVIFSKKYILGWAVTTTFIGHLLIDQFSYSAHPLTYFLSFRLLNNFNLDRLFIH